MERIWNEVAFDTAQRCWSAGQGKDEETRRALERAAVRYFYRACGMDRRDARMANDAPRLRAQGHARY